MEPGVKIQNGLYRSRRETVVIIRQPIQLKLQGILTISAGVLGAELMHAYQEQVYGNLVEITTSTNHVGGTNIEFEEKAFNISRSISESINNIEFGENNIGIAPMVSYNEETTELYYWLDDLSLSHTSNAPITLSQNELNSWYSTMETFQQFHQGKGNGLYGTPIDYNLKPTAILNLINKTKEIDC